MYLSIISFLIYFKIFIYLNKYSVIVMNVYIYKMIILLSISSILEKLP